MVHGDRSHTKNVGAIHESPLHFLFFIHEAFTNRYIRTLIFDTISLLFDRADHNQNSL